MKQVLVFGTGGSAEKLMEIGGDIFDVIGFADNDPKKQGTFFHGRPVYAPAEIRNLRFEQIIIASMWYGDIREQLIEEYSIDAELIRPIPKALLSSGKRYRPFEDESTREYANRVLQHVCSFLELRDIPCYVDHGTLLGLVRDGGLIKWDDDLDLSVAYSDRNLLYECVSGLIATMPQSDCMRWKTELVFNSIDEVVALFLVVEDINGLMNPFNAGISFFRFENGLAVEAINWAPQHYYAGGEWVETSLGRFRFPNFYKEYLELHYGDWKTPVMDMAFSEINNFKKREAPAKWITWNPGEWPSPIPLIKARQEEPIHVSYLYVLASHENPYQGLPRIRVNITELRESLSVLANIFCAEMAVVCGIDPTRGDGLNEILSVICDSRIADKVKVEIGLDIQPSDGVLADMDAVGAQVTFYKKALRKRRDPLASATFPCTNEMRGAVKQFRCRYKNRFLLWNGILARCPMAFTKYISGLHGEDNKDILEIFLTQEPLKQRLLSMFRSRPCAAHFECSSEDSVWDPYRHISENTN